MKIDSKNVAAALCLGLTGAVFAAGDLPPQRAFGGVSYITGGIGLDESAAIRAAAKDFTLFLLFAQTKRGEYLSDVKVCITDKDGKTALEAVSDGPMLLARLPVGAYAVSAEYDGKVLKRAVRVEAKGATRVGFVWKPAAKATME